MDSTAVEMTRNLSEEERKNEIRRIVHEFAAYTVWHLSLTKPDVVSLRVLVNGMLTEWTNEEYVCGSKKCPYCTNEAARGFRHTFRRFIGRSERGRLH